MRVEKETHRQTHTEHGVWSLRSLKRTLSGYRLIMGASRVAARCICKWWINSLWSHMSIIWLLLSKTSLPDNSKTMFICNICICNSWIRQNLLIVFWVVSCFEKGSHFVALADLELGDIYCHCLVYFGRKGTRVISQWWVCLPGMCETLASILGTGKEKKIEGTNNYWWNEVSFSSVKLIFWKHRALFRFKTIFCGFSI